MGEQLGKLTTTMLLLKRVLETLCVLWIPGELGRKIIVNFANKHSHFTESVYDN